MKLLLSEARANTGNWDRVIGLESPLYEEKKDEDDCPKFIAAKYFIFVVLRSQAQTRCQKDKLAGWLRLNVRLKVVTIYHHLLYSKE